MDSFHGLAKPPAEADGHDQVAFVYGAHEMGDASRGGSRENRQAKKRDLILEIIGQNSGEIAGKEYDAPRVVETLGERDKAGCIEAVLEPMQVLEVLFEGIANIGGHARGRSLAPGFLGVERWWEK